MMGWHRVQLTHRLYVQQTLPKTVKIVTNKSIH